jgi:hypothetical protein
VKGQPARARARLRPQLQLKTIPKMPRAWLLSRYRGYWHEAVLVRVRVLSRAGLVFDQLFAERVRVRGKAQLELGG